MLTPPGTAPHAWLAGGFCTAAILVLLPFIFSDTSLALLAAWDGVTAYSYCFLVLPVCAWLAWQRRERLLATNPRLSVAGLVLLLAAGVAWLLGEVSGSMVVCQFALVAMAQGIVLAILGKDIARILLFPLAYLLFLVPVGESFIPALQSFTARFAVMLLHLTGIPVRLDGLLLILPTTSWIVAEACAGLKFLIASIALGALLSEMFLTTWRRRALLMALSVIVPVVANGLRAYMIVVIAYLTDNRYAAGVDHILYGWVLFALVLAGMIGVAIALREPAGSDRPAPAQAASPPISVFVVASILSLLFLASVKSAAVSLERAPASVSIPANPPLAAGGRWKPVAVVDSSPPVFSGADRIWRQAYGDGTATVYLSIGHFAYERPGAEVASSGHRYVSGSIWLALEERWQQAAIGSGTLRVRALNFGAGHERRQVWYWFQVDGSSTANPYLAKLLQLKARLPGAQRSAAIISISTDYARGADGENRATAALARFMKDAK